MISRIDLSPNSAYPNLCLYFDLKHFSNIFNFINSMYTKINVNPTESNHRGYDLLPIKESYKSQ